MKDKLSYEPEYHLKKVAELRADSGFWKGMNPFVSIFSKIAVLSLVMFAIIQKDKASGLFSSANNAILSGFKWWYIGLVACLLLIVLWLAISKYGNIRLGADNEKPEFSYFSWFSMLFGCGMGIGLLFWAVAEPIYHMQSNPWIGGTTGIAASSPEAAEIALQLTFFHWGLHPWAIYSLVGLSLAYFSYRRNLPLSMRSSMYPLIGDKIYGPIGHAVDILAIFATLFGVATSLALGAQQLAAGAYELTGIDFFFDHTLGTVSTKASVFLIALITILATASVVSGLNKGIRILSKMNLILSFVFIGLLFFYGPTRYIIQFFMQSTGKYIGNIIPFSFWSDANSLDPSDWQASWTAFYWAWWLAWSPFVGMFIARISRGRSIREFICGVLLVPTLMGFVWLTVIGGTALNIELFQGGGITEAVNKDVTSALFSMLDKLPVFGGIGSSAVSAFLSLTAVILVMTYFVTSSDSATLVVNTIISVGNDNIPLSHRIIWGLSEGMVAIVLLSIGGTAAIKAMQTASIVSAFPFSIVIAFMVWSLLKSIRQEKIPGYEA